MNQDKAPQEECFDQITGLLKNTSASTPIVFNCQAGISRTTTAMVSHLEPNHLHQDKNMLVSSARSEIKVKKWSNIHFDNCLLAIRAMTTTNNALLSYHELCSKQNSEYDHYRSA